MIFIKLLGIFLALFLLFSKVHGQNNEEEVDIIKIVAIVNDEAITIADLVSRLDLIIITSNMANTVNNRENLSKQVINTLINEKLKFQEAKRLNIKVAESEVRARIALLEERNSVPAGSIMRTLTENGISRSALPEQIKAQLIWDKIRMEVIQPKIYINEREVDNDLNVILSSEGEDEFKYSEIFLNFEQSQQKQSVIDTVIKIREQIHENNFSEIAQQMSQNSSAKYGGLVAWTVASSVPKSLYKVMKNMQVKSISEPIITNTGVYVIKLEDKRKFRIPDLTRSAAEISTLRFNVPATEQNLEFYVESSLREIGKINSCKQLEQIRKSDTIKYSGFNGKVIINKLPQIFSKEIQSLKSKNHSKPLYTNEGVFILMKCEQNSESNQNYALKELIKTKIQNRYFKMLSDRFVLNLKRKALIDVRM